MATKFTVEPQPDGVVVTRDEGDGNVARWNMQGDQIEKHMRGIDDAGHPFNKAKRGDLSAARDMANDARKQIES